ncbi:protease complex subunit PrcB family protein [Flavobacterium sp. SM15]|uniref:protease complex subunit PrcB family protein n=1 Tax=Flavobacterium sp. SM15 TaxID=2908005 RepID=UPI001EDB81AD|nr:protease complex subunit PrcB family protein [Flavobacterium sp. SM15]MCG2611576.1 protease complex subunit PrcB family protein [Flavobacterium sp. SM15]
MKIKILLVSLFALFFSCNSQKEMKLGAQGFRILYQNEYGGAQKQGYDIIDSSEALTDLFTKLQLDSEVYSNFEKIDFSENCVLALYLGQKNTGGYTLSVDKVQNEPGKTIIQRKITGPKQGEMATMALTNPYCLVVVKKNKIYEVK